MSDAVSAIIAAMRAIGLPPEQILAAVEAHHAKEAVAADERRAKDAARKRVERAALKASRPESPPDIADTKDAVDAVDISDAALPVVGLPPAPTCERALLLGEEYNILKPDTSYLSKGNPVEAETEVQPSESKKSKTKGADIRAVLEACLTPRSAGDLMDHRRRKKAELTVRAAEGLVKLFREFGDPERAVELMIVNGWKGFQPEWAANARAGPASSPQKHDPHMAAGRKILGEIHERKSTSNPPIETGTNVAILEPEPRLFSHEGRNQGDRSIGDLVSGLSILRRAGGAGV